MAKRVLFEEKKRHSIKTQVIIEWKRKKILDVREAKGGIHDFQMCKETVGKGAGESILIQADLGYLGTGKLHENSRIPKKESKPHKLTEREKAYDKRLARKRVVIEHINAKIKTFKSMAYPYRKSLQKTFVKNVSYLRYY
ncbi:MAG: transposase [Treponema sp.]|jgi:hypothetical protein|nr:transposase [Treponema sp.]